eukprot:gene16396-biopygen12085
MNISDAVDDAVILISSLPEQYNYLITALETIGEDKLTWDYVRDRLIHEYDKMQGRNASAVGSDPSHDALLMKRDNKVKKKFNQKRVKCLYSNDVSDVKIAENVPDQPDQLDQPDIQPRRSQRTAKPPDRLGTPMTDEWWNHVDLPIASIALQDEGPVSIEEALSGPDASKWKDAADSEYKSVIQNGTWKLVDLPDDKNGCKWIFKKKRNADGSINRYKARLVAQGYSQKEGLDYE